MFARIKTSGHYQYLQLVANRKEQGKTKQQVIATLGRLDQLQAKGDIEKIIRSLAKFSENTLLVLSGKGEVDAHAVSIGPALIFDRLWHELGHGHSWKDRPKHTGLRQRNTRLADLSGFCPCPDSSSKRTLQQRYL